MSSSNKKKRQTIQKCSRCGSCFLNKDFERHRTPRQSLLSTPTGLNEKDWWGSCSEGTSGGNVRGFRLSRIPMIDPGEGFVLREHCLISEGARDRLLLALHLGAWMRRHAALVHPDTLAAAGVRPRSAAIWIRGEAGEAGTEGELIVLWPSIEVPPMQISIRSTTQTGQTSSSKALQNEVPHLLRLSLVHPSPVFISSISLLPCPAQSDLPSELWPQLAGLSHFPLFLRSYFSDAIISAHSEWLDLHYYGHRLIFRTIDREVESIAKMEKEDGLQINGKRNSEMGEGKGREEGAVEVHRMSPMCRFNIIWEEVRKMSENVEGREGEEPESLL